MKQCRLIAVICLLIGSVWIVLTLARPAKDALLEKISRLNIFVLPTPQAHLVASVSPQTASAFQPEISPPSSGPLPSVKAVLTYRVFMKGVYGGDVSLVLTLGPKQYRVDVYGQTLNIAKSLYKVKGSTTTKGWLSPKGMGVSFSENTVVRDGEVKIRGLVYEQGQATARYGILPEKNNLRLVEPLAEEKKEMSAGAVAYPGLIVYLLRQLQSRGSCAGSLSLFDGQRRLRATISDQGLNPVVLPPPFSMRVPARQCDVRFKHLQGDAFDNFLTRSSPPPVTIWMAPMMPGLPPVPVKIDVRGSLLGDGFLLLTSFKRTK